MSEETPEIVADPNALTTEPPAAEPEAATTEAETTQATDPVEATPEPEAAAEPDETAKRMARLAIDARDARRKTRALEAEIAVLRGQKTEQPDEEMERKVAQRAEQLAANKAFANKCNTIFNDGVKQFGESAFKASVTALNETLGQLSPAMIETMDDSGHPAKLLAYLGENLDIAEHIASLPPHRMGVEIHKLANKLTAPKPKPVVSKAPPPITTVNGGATSGGETDPNKMSVSDHLKYVNERMYNRQFGR